MDQTNGLSPILLEHALFFTHRINIKQINFFLLSVQGRNVLQKLV